MLSIIDRSPLAPVLRSTAFSAIDSTASFSKEEQKEVLKIKPGITDLASLRYKDENDLLGDKQDPEAFYINTVMPDKLSLNLEYMKKNNVIFDIYIIIKTIVKCI